MQPARSYTHAVMVAAAAVCLFGSVGGARPEVRGKAGGEAELECRFPPSFPAAVSSASLHVVEWVRQGLDVPVLIRFGSYVPRVHPQYEGRVSLVRVTAMRLEKLRLDDQGSYECRILLLDKPADELRNGTWTLLSVTAPPTFTEAPPPAVEALVGGRLSLPCVASGNPPPTITWLKDGSVVEGANYQDGVLSLGAVSVQSAGRYTCHASNSEGNATRVTKVKIKGPPVIIVPPRSTSLNMSQNALLRCQAVADPPNMTYVWHKGGENVHHIESLKTRVKIMVDGTLLISRLVPEDSGNYTCMPSNGLLTPPTASANLTVMHPARALPMPEETYLPTGMDGVVTCPAAAQPPLLRVDWTKDGEPLDLSLYPGWTLTPQGSLFMATVNDDAAGVYACTPTNSYGSMGSSGPTHVILQDPPTLSAAPEKQYRQEAGRTLLVPCQGNDDPTTKVTWSKVDLTRSISYAIEPNGSLLLQPLTKDHQGAWECSVTNRVASVKASTRVFVLGTSPHPAASLSVSPGVRQANVSWEPGFDGGSAQTFSVWVKKISASSDDDDDDNGKQAWLSMAVPPSSGAWLRVTGLSPATDYQFSVLSHNKVGTGPFSEIATARTLDPLPTRSQLKPPASLSADRGPVGVVLRWSLPEEQRPPITGFVLQSRAQRGDWFNLVEDIGANSSEIVVPGLHKDGVYELRLLSRRGELLSEPSPSVNVSTMAMEIYPGTSRLLEFVPEPLLAGVLGGVGFMCLALVLLLGAACVISHRRNQRRRKKTKKDEPPPAIYKCSPSIKTPGTSSPDSVLKKSLLPASSLHPTTSSATPSSSSFSSSSGVENPNRRKRPPSSPSGGHLTRTTSSPISPSIEMICRGPDGRFTLPPFDPDTLSVHSRKSFRCHQGSRVRRSVSLHSAGEDRKERPFVLSVDLPPLTPAEAASSSQHLPRHHGYILNHKGSYAGFPDISSLCSNSSLATIPQQDRGITPTFPVLPHIRSGLGQTSTTASALVLQMEHERERGNLSRCLKLAQEREELEKELKMYTLERGPMREVKRQQRDWERGEAAGDDGFVWEYKSSTLPHRYPQGGRKSGGLTVSPLSSSSVHWDGRPLVSPLLGTSSPVIPSCVKSGNHQSAPSFTDQTPLQFAEAGDFSRATLTPPHLPAKHRRHERVEAAPRGFDNSPQSTVLETQQNDWRSEAQRRSSLVAHGSRSMSSFHSSKCAEGSDPAAAASFHRPAGGGACAEMSVDEPEPDVCETRPMLHHRIASHVQHGRSLTHRGQNEDWRRSTSFSRRAPASGERAAASPQPPGSQGWRPGSRGSRVWDSQQRSRSLDSRRRNEYFPPPDVWIDSLSQENFSAASSLHADTPFWEPEGFPTEKSPANSPSATQDASCSPPALNSLPAGRSPDPDGRCHHEPRPEDSILPNAAKWPITYHHHHHHQHQQEATNSSEGSRCFAPRSNNQEPLDVEAGGYEGVLESGSNYSSYASSGRGSMEPANRRLSLCHLSPTLASSPETVEESQGNTEDEHRHRVEPGQRRKASVDENYEWDADVCPRPGDCDDLLLSMNLLKPPPPPPPPPPCCGLPSMPFSAKTVRKCTQLSSHPGRRSSCSAEPEPDTVLF